MKPVSRKMPLEDLDEATRRAVTTAVADNVLEGWKPSPSDVDRLAELASGTISFDDYRRSVLSQSAG